MRLEEFKRYFYSGQPCYLISNSIPYDRLTMNASVRTLNILAAVVWYGGGISLTIKGFSLIMEAGIINPHSLGWRLAALFGLALGGVKAWYLFNRACKKNLERIAAISNPKIWNFYRLWFFGLLACLIYAGSTLSHQAHGNYPFLLLMGVLDISIGIALLGSSYVFWVRRAFFR